MNLDTLFIDQQLLLIGKYISSNKLPFSYLLSKSKYYTCWIFHASEKNHGVMNNNMNTTRMSRILKDSYYLHFCKHNELNTKTLRGNFCFIDKVEITFLITLLLFKIEASRNSMLLNFICPNLIWRFIVILTAKSQIVSIRLIWLLIE